jgi:S1-C subfamily serine protease
VYAANIGADLALVKVDNYAKLPPPVEIADSNKLQQGQWAIAIGEPFELKQSVTLGVVSASTATRRSATAAAAASSSRACCRPRLRSTPATPAAR